MSNRAHKKQEARARRHRRVRKRSWGPGNGPASPHHTVRSEQLSVREQMAHILRCLQGGEFVPFDSLFDLDEGLPKLIVTFIALLELAKEYLLEIVQNETYGSIHVRSHPVAA